MLIARTPKIVIADAAWVRLTRLEHSNPNASEPERGDDQHEVAVEHIVGRDPTEHEDDAVSGIEAAIRSQT